MCDCARPAVKFTIMSGAELVERARSKALRGWGKADQALPEH